MFFFLSFVLFKNFTCSNGYSPLGRMLSVMLEGQHEKLCKPVLKPSFPWLLIQSFVVWQLACLLGCLAPCFPHVVYGICLWNSTRHPDQFLPAGSSVQVASFCCNLCFNPYSLLKTFMYLSLGLSCFYTW